MVCVGSTLLIYASEHGNLPVVKHLLEHKANIDAKNKYGMLSDSTSAVLFSLHVCGRMCLWMLMCGVDVMLFPGWTPLIKASYNGNLPVVKHLLELKANIEAKTNGGMFLDSASAVLFSLHVCGRMCL